MGTRAEELVALAGTVKVLNDDDALDLFKKTLPSSSASLVQIKESSTAMRSHALATLRQAVKMANGQDRPGLELLTMALTGKRAGNRGGFGEVIKMVDEMVGVLGKEQQDDNDKKEYCGKQFDVSDDKKKSLERTVKLEGNAIATAEDSIATLSEEIASLIAGIKNLDRSVAEATEQRREENTEFKALVASDTAEDHKGAKAAGVKELMATEKYISSLHAECDWLLQYFDVRKEARAGEVDSLKKAKAVLSGADYSLV